MPPRHDGLGSVPKLGAAPDTELPNSTVLSNLPITSYSVGPPLLDTKNEKVK
jgi:hypothetical protein